MHLVNTVVWLYSSHDIRRWPSLLPSRARIPLTCAVFPHQTCCSPWLEAGPQAVQGRGWWGEGESSQTLYLKQFV